MSLLVLLVFHSWDSEFINQILILAFVLKCPLEGKLALPLLHLQEAQLLFQAQFPDIGLPSAHVLP